MSQRLRSVVHFMIPRSLRLRLRSWVAERRRNLWAPKMIWGYIDSSGNFRQRTRISTAVSMYHREKILIGDNVYIGHFCILDGTESIVIGDGAQLAGWNSVYTHSSHVAIRLYGEHYGEVPEGEKRGYARGHVEIGKYAFLGAGAKVFAGVTIGKGALVMANSVVTGNVDDFQIVAGIPARPSGDTREMDRQYLEDPVLRAWYEEWQSS